jgi:hypothetical protein
MSRFILEQDRFSVCFSTLVVDGFRILSTSGVCA